MTPGTLFDAAELVDLRDMITSAQPDSATITRPTLTPDQAGGQTTVWVPVSTVSARVATLGRLPKEQLIASRVTGVDLWAISLPNNTDVRNQDRIVVAFADGSPTRTYEVKGLATEGSWAVETRVIVVEVV